MPAPVSATGSKRVPHRSHIIALAAFSVPHAGQTGISSSLSFYPGQ
jgi:hypothetical protein